MFGSGASQPKGKSTATIKVKHAGGSRRPKPLDWFGAERFCDLHTHFVSMSKGGSHVRKVREKGPAGREQGS